MQDIIKEKGLRDYIQTDEPVNNVGREFYEALDNHVKELINRAQERAEANNRTTVLARDL